MTLCRRITWQCRRRPEWLRCSRVFGTPAGEPRSISYVYVVNGDSKTLMGVVDLRELTLAPDEDVLDNIMVSPVVTARKTPAVGIWSRCSPGIITA